MRVVQVSKDAQELRVDVSGHRWEIWREFSAYVDRGRMSDGTLLGSCAIPLTGFRRKYAFILDEAFDPGQHVIDVLWRWQLHSLAICVNPGVVHSESQEED